MNQPLWEDQVPFKTALGIATLLKRKYEAQIKGLESKIQDLKAKIDVFESNKDMLGREPSLAALLAATERRDEEVSDNFFTELASLQLWSNAAETLGSTHHRLLHNVRAYDTAKRLYIPNTQPQSSLENAKGPSDLFSKSLTVSPVTALVELAAEIIQHPDGTKYSNLLNQITHCLQRCCLDADRLMLTDGSDFCCLQAFVSWILGLIVGEIGTTKDIAEASGVLLAKELLSHLQTSAGSGYIVLGCAAQQTHTLLTNLTNSITAPEQENDHEMLEKMVVAAFHMHVGVLQDCLRNLPSWMLQLSPDESFLRSVTNTLWVMNDTSKILVAAWPEVPRAAQRSVALLMAALQQISNEPRNRNDKNE